MTLQTILVALALLASVGYALYRVRQAWKTEADPCDGCSGCALKDMKKQCDKKKVAEKFG